jgi:hypothetical protein
VLAAPNTARGASTEYCTDVVLSLPGITETGPVEGTGSCSFSTGAAALRFSGTATGTLDCGGDSRGEFSYTGTVTARMPDGSVAFAVDFAVQHVAWVAPDIYRRWTTGAASLALGDAGFGAGTFQLSYSWGGAWGFVAPPADLCHHDDLVDVHAPRITIPRVAPTAAPPVASDNPRVSGAARVGSVLTATNGVWLGEVTSYDYGWQRCDQLGAVCEDLQGAWSRTYTPVQADVGHTLRIRVTACNVNGCGPPAASDATAAVTAG